MSAARTDHEVAVQAVDDRLATGGTAILDAPEHVPAIVGRGDQVLWAQGEPCILVGPAGVGKTTVAQQAALARCGVAHRLELLGLTVMPDPDRYVLYMAADRPQQAMRSFRRMVKERDRPLLDSSLLIWRGPPPVSLVDDPAAFAAWVKVRGAGTLIIDSLKDVAMPLSDEEVGGKVNQAMQHLVAEGIEVLALHHQRKATADNRKPRSLADVYGSTWITAGAGSVVLLWGEPGDPVVELTHLKQPADDIGPLTVTHDHAKGTSTALGHVGARQIIEAATNGGVTVKDAAQRLFAAAEPTANEIEKARRKLDAEVRQGHAVKVDGGPNDPARYRPVDRRVIDRERTVSGSRSAHDPSRNGSPASHVPLTTDHAGVFEGATTPLRGVAVDPTVKQEATAAVAYLHGAVRARLITDDEAAYRLELLDALGPEASLPAPALAVLTEAAA